MFYGRTTTLFNLFVFRFAYCFLLAISLAKRCYWHWTYRDNGLVDGLLVLWPFQGHTVSGLQFLIAAAVLIGSLLLAAFGIRPRLFAAVALLALLNIFYPIDRDFRPYDDNISVFNLLILALAPIPAARDFRWSQSLAVQGADWPREYFKVNLILCYLAAFVSKMINGGWAWLQGSTLQGYLYEKYFITGSALTHYVASHLWICTLLSWFTIFAELTFFTVLSRNRLAPWVALAGFFLHVGIYLLLHLNFLFSFALTYLAFLPYDRIYLFLRDSAAAVTARPLRARAH